MTYLGRLFRVELAAQISLVVCSLLFGMLFLVLGYLGAERPDGGAGVVLGASALIGLNAYLYCVGPVALVIAPIYAGLEARSRANAMAAICISLIPGLLAFMCSGAPLGEIGDFVSAMAPAFLVIGVSIGMGIHFIRTWKQS